jgi:hypothetical protein
VPRKAAAGPGAGSLQLPDRLSVMVNDTALGGTYLGGRGWPGDRGLVVPPRTRSSCCREDDIPGTGPSSIQDAVDRASRGKPNF